MPLKEKLMEDMKAAMREKDVVKKNTIQLVRAAILQIEKDDKVELFDEQIIDVVASQLKKRRDALPEYENSGRTDLLEDLQREIEVLMEYLPEQLSDEELETIVKETIEEMNASSMKDMGKVMSAIIPKVKGRADNGKVSMMVKKILS